MQRPWIAFLVILSFLCVSHGKAAALPAPAPLIISYVTGNATHWDIDVARDQGFFRQQGFAPEVVPFHSSPQSIQLLVSGAADVASLEPEALVEAVLHGASDLGALGQQELTPDWMLIVRPEIKTWTDIKGKRLGFSTLATAEVWLTQELLQKHGIGKDEVIALQVGISPAKLAALKNGSISGSVLFQPLAHKALEEGMRDLANFSEVGEYPPTLLPVRRSWAAKERNGIRLATALRQAHAWLYDRKNHDAAVAILEKYTNCSAAIADALYQSYFVTDKLYSRDAAVRLSGLRRVLELMAAHGQIPAGKTPRPEDFLIAKADGGMSE